MYDDIGISVGGEKKRKEKSKSVNITQGSQTLGTALTRKRKCTCQTRIKEFFFRITHFSFSIKM